MKSETSEIEHKPVSRSERGEVKKLSDKELSASRMSRLARYPGPEIYDDEAESKEPKIQIILDKAH